MSRLNPFRLAVCAALCFLGINNASAALLDRGGGMIYDDVLNITWLQDFNYAATSGYDTDGFMTWDNANTWANALTVGGYDDWRLPTFDPAHARPTTITLTNEIGSLWLLLGGGSSINSGTDISPFINLETEFESQWYWTALEGSYQNETSKAWRFSMECGCWDAQSKNMEYQVMAVRTGDVSIIPAIPEPETYAMLLAGLSLIGFSARRRKNLYV